MQQFIDFFSRLLIATITFVVPIIIYLLSSFAEGVKRRKDLAKATEESLTREAAVEIQSNPETLKQTINKPHEELKKMIYKQKRSLIY